MTLFLLLAVLIVVVAVVAGAGWFAGPRRTRVIDRTYVSEPVVEVDDVDDVIEEPVRRRRVRRRVER